ncbi:MAG TPA: PH domain-containing protein, partial [Bacillales bacterium]|nr:PH domain-containing protein [Bacillales bacterium]
LENMLYGKTEVSGTNRETAVNARRRLPVFDLFVAGATSGKIGVVLSVLGAIFSQIDTLLPKHFYSNVLRNLVESSLSFIVLLIFAIAVCAWILAILGTMIKYAGFTLSRADHELQISYGLLERRRVTIEIRRIQAVRVVEGMLRQPFGLATVYVESAGGSGGKEEDYSTVLFPLLRKKELPSFFGEFVPDYPGSPKFVPAPKNALPHYVIRQVLFLLVILVPVAIWIPWGVWSLILLPWAAILGAMQYRAAGWATSGEFRVLRFRHLRRMTVFIPRRNIQARERRQSFFQEKSKVATYQVSVMSKRAGKNFRVAYLDERQVRELVKIR